MLLYMAGFSFCTPSISQPQFFGYLGMQFLFSMKHKPESQPKDWPVVSLMPRSSVCRDTSLQRSQKCVRYEFFRLLVELRWTSFPANLVG